VPGGAAQRKALIDRYRTGYSAVDIALAGITDAELDRQPAGGGWTPRMVVHHLADSETYSAIRLRRLVAEPNPAIPGYDEELWSRSLHYETRPIGPALALLAAVRGANLQLLEALTELEWERHGTHSEHGPYSVDDWLRIYSSHSHDHAEQIRRARTGR